MPYFVYKINEQMIVKNLELLAEFENFKEAKNFAKEQRSANSELAVDAIKVIFAKTELEAEEQLQESRDKPIMMEWEK